MRTQLTQHQVELRQHCQHRLLREILFALLITLAHLLQTFCKLIPMAAKLMEIQARFLLLKQENPSIWFTLTPLKDGYHILALTLLRP
jgi:hypothetical protein